MDGEMTLGVEELDRRIRESDRLLVMYYANWCGYSARFLPDFEAYVRKGSVPAVGADLADDDDPRWDSARVDVVPTVVYYEGGVPVARLDGRPMRGIPKRAFHKFLEEHVPGGAP